MGKATLEKFTRRKARCDLTSCACCTLAIYRDELYYRSSNKKPYCINCVVKMAGEDVLEDIVAKYVYLPKEVTTK